MKKVLFLSTRRGTGGAELNCLMLAEEFARRGMKVEMWCLYDAGQIRESFVPIRFFLGKSPSGILSFLKMVFCFFFELRRFRPDCAYGFQPLANIIGSISMIGLGPFYASQRNPSSSQRFIIRWIEAFVGSTTLYSGNICVSDYVKSTYLNYPGLYRDKLKVIHNGLEPLCVTGFTKKDARSYLGLPDKCKIIGAVARLHEQKNPGFLIEVVRSIPDCHLVYAGDGPLEKFLRISSEDIKDRVHFLGRLEGKKLSAIYEAIDVLVFPSIYEGFGRTLIEAMSFGVPVVANDIDVAREVMGEAGIYCDLIPDKWVDSIVRSFSINNSEKLINRSSLFSLDVMVNKYMRIMEGA